MIYEPLFHFIAEAIQSVISAVVPSAKARKDKK